ncbi:MAG TPA: AI-2E family transporter [Blastocatellia bacterium]|nr:AI-2E family transporter [Blastocatellia bacterium]
MIEPKRSNVSVIKPREERWPRKQLRPVVLFIATGIAVATCYFIARPFLPTLAWALALTIIAYPLHDWLQQRVKNKNLAALLAVIIVAVVIVAPTIIIAKRVVEEATHGWQLIQAEAASGRWRMIIESNPRLAPIANWIITQANLPGLAERTASFIAQQTSVYLRGSILAVAELFITFFFLFYFFRDRESVLRTFRSLVPLSSAETDYVFGRVSDTVYATVYGTLAVATIQGLLGGLMFWVLGLPAPLLWGTVMGLLAIVPMLGTFLVWLPVAAYLALEGQWGKAIILGVWGLAVISLVDNLLYPFLVGNRLRMHVVPVFISIIGGIALFGPSGIILGPTVLAVTMALLEVWKRRESGGVGDEEMRR